MKGTEPVTRSEIVRCAYRRFNDKDFDGVLELCDPDIELRDLLTADGRAYGREAVRQRFIERFLDATVHVTVADVVEMGYKVIAVACSQVYDSAGDPVGPTVVATDHFSFRGDRILRVETTESRELPNEIRAVLLGTPVSTDT